MGARKKTAMSNGIGAEDCAVPLVLSDAGFSIRRTGRNKVLFRHTVLSTMALTLCFGEHCAYFLRMLAELVTMQVHPGPHSRSYLNYISRRTATPGLRGSMWMKRAYPTVNLSAYLSGGSFTVPSSQGYWIVFIDDENAFNRDRDMILEVLTSSGFAYKFWKDRFAISNLESIASGLPPTVFEMIRLKPEMFFHLYDARASLRGGAGSLDSTAELNGCVTMVCAYGHDRYKDAVPKASSVLLVSRYLDNTPGLYEDVYIRPARHGYLDLGVEEDLA